MDIILERILSLIPRNQDGTFVHGSLKNFANSIGLKSGNLVSDWMHDRSSSYKNYLYEISAKYNVSVEWLKGKTDEKAPTQEGEREITFDDFTYAMHNESGDLTDGDKEWLLSMARRIAEDNRKRNQNLD